MKEIIRDLMIICGMGGGGRKKNIIQRIVSLFRKQ